jgi:hypothetical protein
MIRKRHLELERIRFAMRVLRNAGASGRNIEELYLGRHSDDCACWRCVLDLRNEVTMHRAVLVAKARWQAFSTAEFADEGKDNVQDPPQDAVPFSP